MFTRVLAMVMVVVLAGPALAQERVRKDNSEPLTETGKNEGRNFEVRKAAKVAAPKADAPATDTPTTDDPKSEDPRADDRKADDRKPDDRRHESGRPGGPPPVARVIFIKKVEKEKETVVLVPVQPPPTPSAYELARIAKDPKRAMEQRRRAVGELDDAGLLADVAQNVIEADLGKAAIAKLTDSPTWLADVAKNAKSESVAWAATEKLTDPDALLDVADNARQTVVRLQAADRLAKILARVAKNVIVVDGQDPAVAVRNAENEQAGLAAVDTLAKPLAYIACDAKDEKTGLAALKMLVVTLSDVAGSATTEKVRTRAEGMLPAALVYVAGNAQRESVRLEALKGLADPEDLADVAMHTEHSKYIKTGIAAVKKLTDPEQLADVATKAKLPRVRNEAKKQLALATPADTVENE